MALNWDWDYDYCGYIEYSHDLELKDEGGAANIVRLYRGNAMLIALIETLDGEEWRMCNFLVDKEHMLRCFGKRKGYTDYPGFPFSIRIGGKDGDFAPACIYLDPERFTSTEIGMITQTFVGCPEHVPVKWCTLERLHETT